MAYPIIMNGDHAEFERDHANVSHKQRPDWPLPSFDARDWADAFCSTTTAQMYHSHFDNKPIDREWMVTWFANALMRGYDEHAARAHADNDQLRSALRYGIGAALNEMTARNLPLEWSPDSGIGKMLAALGINADRMTPEVRRELSVTE